MKTRDGEVLADLVRHGDRYLAAHGGRGGRGNARFLSNARRAPSFAEQGEYGEEHWLRLEVKLLADAALVGLPERGQVDADLGGERGQAQDRRLPVHHPRAPPRRGALPRPRVRARRHPRAHRGRGRGPRARPQFLRHVERARVLVLLLDLAPRRRPHARGAGARCCSTSSAATGPSCSNGPASSSAARPTSPPPTARRASDVLALSAVTAPGPRRVPRAPRHADRRGARRRSPSPSRSWCCARSRRASPWCATTTARGGSPGRTAERVVAMADLTNDRGDRVRAAPAAADGRRAARSRAPAHARATSCASAPSSSSTSRGSDVRRGREGRDVVDHVGAAASSTTSRCGSCAASSRRRAHAGHEVVLVSLGRDRRGAARARADHAPDRHRHAAGGRRGRPAAPHGAPRRDPRRRTACVAGQVLLTPARLRRALAVPARPRDAAPPARPRRGARW